MRKIREIQYLKKYFWDYELYSVSDITLAQRVVDFFPYIVNDIDGKNLNREDFICLIKIIKENFNEINFKSSIKENIIKYVSENFN